ncbi:MAG: hypothetical protein LBE31_07485, partial [Deltaproteobacteria bacterium]|nr:hypothetical protein [Deltaproteobacteria bacterium]
KENFTTNLKNKIQAKVIDISDTLTKIPRKILILSGVGIILAFIALINLTSGPGPGPESSKPSGPDPEALYAAHLDELYPYVEGSDALRPPPKPAFLTEMLYAGGRAAALAQATEAFMAGQFSQALEGFSQAGRDLPPDPHLLTLMAAANLRLLNYGQAKAQYNEALALRASLELPDDLAEASLRLGLALCLFHEPDHDGSLREASLAWNIRKEDLGSTAPETLAALNVMATSLIALSRTAVAGDILLESITMALAEGRKPSDPSLLDSLSILALAFEAQGRLDELSALFGPLDEETASASPSSSQGQNAPSEDKANSSPVTDLDEARKVLSELKKAHPQSGVIPVLSLGILDSLTGSTTPPCNGPFSSVHFAEISQLCLSIAIGYGRIGQAGEMARILRGFAALTPPPTAAAGSAQSLYQISELLAAYLTSTGDLKSAETVLRQSLKISESDTLSDSQEAKEDRAKKIIILSMRLADNILAQGRQPIEAELELTAALTKLNSLFKRSEIDSQPQAALLFLRLGLVLKTLGRTRESRDMILRVNQVVSSASLAHPESAAYLATLTPIAESVNRSSAAQAQAIDLSPFYKVALPSEMPPIIPSDPEIMRQELTALKILGRPHDFRPMIDAALKWSFDHHGQTSGAYRRYQSLFLKYLEESGDIPSLLIALDDLTANPGFPPGRESLAIKTAALRYKARILMERGYNAEAIAALIDARNLLFDQPEFSQKLLEIESEIQRLTSASPLIQAQ